jgi:hypothetical protein
MTADDMKVGRVYWLIGARMLRYVGPHQATGDCLLFRYPHGVGHGCIHLRIHDVLYEITAADSDRLAKIAKQGAGATASTARLVLDEILSEENHEKT